MLHATSLITCLKMINEWIAPTLNSMQIIGLVILAIVIPPLLAILPLLLVKEYAQEHPVIFTVSSLFVTLSVLALLDVFVIVPLLAMLAPIAPMVYLAVELSILAITSPAIYCQIKKVCQHVKASEQRAEQRAERNAKYINQALRHGAECLGFAAAS